MLERICAECRHSNPIEITHCASCGHVLQSVALVKHQQKAPMVVSGRKMPAIYVPSPVKKAAAVGLVGVVVNAGINYLRRRLTQPTNQQPNQLANQPTPKSSNILIAQRITEKWSRGTLRERTIENIAIKKNEPK